MLSEQSRFRANLFSDKVLQESCKNYLPFCFLSLDDGKGISGANALVSHFRPLVTGRAQAVITHLIHALIHHCTHSFFEVAQLTVIQMELKNAALNGKAKAFERIEKPRAAAIMLASIAQVQLPV